MPSNPAATHIAFLWHLHQPLYKVNKTYVLPWVRLHCVKDYYPMAKLIEENAAAKVVFNFSGVLLEQLLDYAENNPDDYYQRLTLKDPRHLSAEEKTFLIERFFSIHPQWSILPHARYRELYQKRQDNGLETFTAQDYLDTQAYFNLAWFHSLSVEKDPHLKKLFRKGRNFNADDKEYIIKKQHEVITETLELYKKLVNDGKIEISISPHYHPILPLVCDTDILRNFSYLKTPGRRFRHPEDAHQQIRKAKTLAEQMFGKKVEGSWPSEGSVSEDVSRIFFDEGIKWICTDEDILFNSFANAVLPFAIISKQRRLIYRPYLFEDTTLFFRDKNLSNTISFAYQNWDNQTLAAEDLINHCKTIHDSVSGIYKENLVLIAMDGENAWEYYQDNGQTFLSTVYRRIAEEETLRFSTLSEYRAAHHMPFKRLQRIAAGSWINADFSVWSGSQQNNKYWFWLKQLRDQIEEQKENLGLRDYQKILEVFYILEGSDWYWWNTFKETSGEFTNIFNFYLNKLQKLLDTASREPVAKT